MSTDTQSLCGHRWPSADDDPWHRDRCPLQAADIRGQHRCTLPPWHHPRRCRCRCDVGTREES